MPLDHEKIRTRREKLGITQQEAADRAGMPRPHWARIETGKRPNPSLMTAEQIAAALRCSIPSLLQ